MELPGKQELFCREYLKDCNGPNAVERAGYGARSDALGTRESSAGRAHRLLAQPEIQERIAGLAAERHRKLELDAQDIIVELLRMLTSDPLNYVDEDGRVKSLAEIPLDARRAIASFEVDTVGEAGAVTRTKVKFWSKEKAAELLGKHLALFKEVLNIEGLDDLAKRIVDARDRVERKDIV